MMFNLRSCPRPSFIVVDSKGTKKNPHYFSKIRGSFSGGLF